MTCNGTNVDGSPCRVTILLEDGKCQAHQPGGRERLAAIAASGGLATAAKHAGEPLEEKDLRPLVSTDDAKLALVDIRNYVATRRITHAEGNAMSKTIEGWLKADAAGMTRIVVDEFKREIVEKERQIEELKRQLVTAGRARPRIA